MIDQNLYANTRFILNPNSGRFRKFYPVLKTLFKQHQIGDDQVHFTNGPKDATRIAKELSSQKNLKIFAIGGDGTVNETAKGLIGTDSCLGIIPMGSGNGLARYLKIPMDPHKIIRQLAQAKTIVADYGLCNDRPFFVTSSIGFSASVAQSFDNFGIRGPIPYFLLTSRVYINAKPFQFEMIIDGMPIIDSAIDITIANANQYGNNARIAPNASIDDGFLDIVIIRKPPITNIPVLARQLFNGQLQDGHLLRYFRGKNVELRLKKEQKFAHIDGEPFFPGSKTISWQIKPKAIKMISF